RRHANQTCRQLATGAHFRRRFEEHQKSSRSDERICRRSGTCSLTRFGTIPSISPLLGLFGTVVGMIEIFGSQTAVGNSPAILAHGISVALYNTAYGLIVAIPSMIFYRHFRSQVDTLTMEMA